MRIFMFASVVLSLCIGSAFAQNPPPAPANKPATKPENKPATKPAAKPAAPQKKMDSKEAATIVAGEIGRGTASKLKKEVPDLDIEAFIQGLREGFSGAKKPKYSPEQLQQAFEVFQADLIEKEGKLAEKNLRDGKEFLAKNKDKKGVKTTASGLQYEVIKSGTGATPKDSDAVKVHYHGTLLDGTVFDSSVERKEPIVFPVNGVIPGWTEALKLMKVGDKWKLYIPSELAYGKRGSGDIGPDAVLTFEVELLGVESGKPARGGKEILPIGDE